MRRWLPLAPIWILLCTGAAFGHAADQGFVLLLPTDVYITAAVLAFVLTVGLIAYLPAELTDRLSDVVGPSRRLLPQYFFDATSLISTVAFFVLVYVGLTGPRDPLSNLFPLTIWSIFWMGFVSLHAIFGQIWRWIDPWAGLYRLVFGTERKPPLSLPRWLGIWPAILGFMLFTSFSIADVAPYDPARLAQFAIWYWVFTFAGMALFGQKSWSEQCECFSVFFRALSLVSPIRSDPGFRMGFPGWAITAPETFKTSMAIFCLAFLGTGSFDGLNETFWWLAQIGVNPLDFQGRSTIVMETTLGLTGSVILLIVIFWGCVALGKRLAGKGGASTQSLFYRLSFSLLPIGLGFHIAHFLTTFLVTAQYARVALTDPMATGANWLAFTDLRVYVGFLRDAEIVRVLWLSQALIVVLSHVIAVTIAHRIMREAFPTKRQAQLAELPLSIFMVVYTLFGLWLLAAARGA